MFPQKEIYSDFRTKCLTFFNDEVSNNIYDPSFFKDFIASGYYTIDSHHTNKILFKTHAPALAITVYNDIEHYLNCALEHLIDISEYTQNFNNRSETWNTVSIYYFAFYSTQVFNRLLGKFPIYINQSTSSTLSVICGAKMAAGTYNFEGDFNDLDDIKFKLTKNSNKIHEASWNSLFTFIEDAISNHKNSKAGSAAETLFFENSTFKNLRTAYNSHAWPSEVRNKFNYKPGLGYRSLINSNNIGIRKYLYQILQSQPNNTISLLSKGNEIAFDSEDDKFQEQVKCLVTLSFAIFITSISLYKDLKLRRDIVFRNEKSRKNNLKQYSGYTIINYFLNG